ncbi:MAG: hypothetical protein IPP77_04770 [Bacteroidetes bacterium]|nr:hypothetical protein [Bacteroidota bacterium]
MIIIALSRSTRSMRKRPLMPNFVPYVKDLMYRNKISIPRLAGRLSTTPDTVYRMMRRDDWKMSEIILTGEILKTNLFEFFVKPASESPATEVSASLEGTAPVPADEIQTLRHRNELLEQENRLLREMMEIMKQKGQP